MVKIGELLLLVFKVHFTGEGASGAAGRLAGANTDSVRECMLDDKVGGRKKCN